MKALRLTWRGRGVLLTGCALLVTGVITDVPLALAAGVFALAVAASALGWVAFRRRGVRISRQAPPHAWVVGRELRTVATITGGRSGLGPALVRHLTPDHDDAGALVRLDRSETPVERTCVMQRRGIVEWPAVGVELPDPLGIAIGSRHATPSGRTLVFPQTIPLGRGDARPAAGDSDLAPGPSSRRRPGDPGPIPRAYQPGDEFRRMHWPATARTGDPMVRATEPQAARTALITIDCSEAGYRDPEAFERAVTACASIADWFLDQGWSISVRTARGSPLTDPAGLLGRQGRDRIMTALAVLRWDSPGAAVPPAQPGSGDAVIAIHGAHGRVPPPPAISLGTEEADASTLFWDGTAPLSWVWAAATREQAIA